MHMTDSIRKLVNRQQMIWPYLNTLKVWFKKQIRQPCFVHQSARDVLLNKKLKWQKPQTQILADFVRKTEENLA